MTDQDSRLQLYIVGESFTGDAVVVDFTLAHAPVARSVSAFVNGLRTADFTVAGSVVTFGSVPAMSAVILIDYFYR